MAIWPDNPILCAIIRTTRLELVVLVWFGCDSDDIGCGDERRKSSYETNWTDRDNGKSTATKIQSDDLCATVDTGCQRMAIKEIKCQKDGSFLVHQPLFAQTNPH